MFRELERKKAAFDLPARGSSGPIRGATSPSPSMIAAPSTPFGPAAGPHTQLAQNIVLSWLAGGRVIELKTVQVKDDIDSAAALHRHGRRSATTSNGRRS